MIAKQTLQLAAFAVLTVTLAAPVWARGGRHFGGPERGRAPHSRGLLGQLIFPCPAACAADADECFDTANSEALTCISGSCAAEVSAAQSACGEDRSSQECEDAVDALADCADACLDTRADAVDVCRDTQRDCRDACEADE